MLGMIVSAGVAKFMFFSVNKNEVGVWLRWGHPVYRRNGTMSVLRHGRPGIRLPFIYHIVKVCVAINPTATDDIEMERLDPVIGKRESWKGTSEIFWRVKGSDEDLVRAIFSTKDETAALEQSVKSTVQRTIKEVLKDSPIGTMERSQEILEAVKERCQSAPGVLYEDREQPVLDDFGVELIDINVFRLRPVDASIIRGLLDPTDPSDPPDDTAKIVTVIQQDVL